ncbi:Bug family tripartite tricarboxylate transporter substrate binding protein [Comamonas odontotermitis]|uniref:Bug family tripartite tricarboxylate transporter substrate binding protein n=1 Tax=Comamonas odontotermitis TaxID=379895 RepID=UPI001CC81144|nr:Bug family tripartite tricarboxylate transporter substrate binding protein [Comamonas odontotermitis]UBB16798.1 Bug family tripartite tricarboxylate transporter substrate binding protein [Comamonas odontotermitis]
MVQRRQFIGRSAALAAAPVLATTAALWATPVQAQEVVRIIVGYPPGGATDRVARIVGDKLQAEIGASVIVENKVGAGGRVAAQYVKNVPASQPMLMLANPAVMVVAPLVVGDLGYDADKDFVPVSEVNSYVFGVAVSSAVPVKEMQHLLAWLKANPAKANIGVPATGSLPHFFALMLGQQAGVQAEAVGYKGSSPLLTDLMGGQVPVAVDTLDTLVQQHNAGKLRILAVSGDARNAAVPQVPTLKEAGVNLAAAGWNTFFAPKAMPAAQVQRYADAIQKVMKDPEVHKQFAANYLDPVVSNRAQTQQRLEAYRKQWAPVIQASGYKP